jgi:DNA-binding transcriptional LysR family regulator
MNIHHLELFYYVAKHDGIAGAVRNMPYGIQQPAVSAQVIQLENNLGVQLFQRRPFELLPSGVELFAFVQPFFENLDSVGETIRGGTAQTIRIGASGVVFREHLPEVLATAKNDFPTLRPTLRVGIQPEIEKWLLEGEIDLGVTVIDTTPPAELKHDKLLELPMVLVVPNRTKLKSAAAILEQDRIEQTLISLPNNEGISRTFQKELAKRKIDWPSGMEMNSLDLIDNYVSNGFGIGLSLNLPQSKRTRGVKLLTLNDFPNVGIGALWRGQLTPLAESLVRHLKQHVNTL